MVTALAKDIEMKKWKMTKDNNWLSGENHFDILTGPPPGYLPVNFADGAV
jgi:hypothetical protein